MREKPEFLKPSQRASPPPRPILPGGSAAERGLLLHRPEAEVHSVWQSQLPQVRELVSSQARFLPGGCSVMVKRLTLESDSLSLASWGTVGDVLDLSVPPFLHL